MKKIKGINCIVTLYEDARMCDKSLLADMRTNVMLRNGKHYSETTTKSFKNLRDKGVISENQRIKITKNHMHRITNDYINSILSRNPSSAVRAYNESDMSDVKDAELSNAVMQDIKLCNSWKRLRRDFVTDQVVVGETYATIKFDYSSGKIAKDMYGQEYPIGQIKIEKRMGFECKRDSAARSFQDCRYIMFDKSVDLEDARSIVKKLAPEKVDALSEDSCSDNIVGFDINKGVYSSEAKKTLFIETYIRKCAEYPNGQYILSTKEFIIFQMDLPLGIFPVYQLGFDPIQTTPRCSSIISVARPYQAEINRASSKQTEHQITIGDDKLVISSASSVTNGGKMHGVRVMKTDGEKPVYLAGRDGGQFTAFILEQIRQMYQAVNLPHLINDAATGEKTGDPLSLLYKSMSQRGIYAFYLEMWEDFEKELFTDAIRLAKHYYSEDHVIKIVGKKEQVNIQEFRDTSDDGFDIVIEESNGDIETKYGKLLTITNILQYTGSNLSQEQIGQLIKELPYANKERVFNSLTTNVDLVENMLLALDRGEQPPIPKFANVDMLLSALANRTVQPDFVALPPEKKMLYQQYIQQLEQTKAQQQLQVQQASQGLIPADGFLTTVNASVKNPTTGKVERIKMPSQAIAWLWQKLNQQGLYSQQMSQLGPEATIDINNMATQQQSQQPVPQGQGMMPNGI